MTKPTQQLIDELNETHYRDYGVGVMTSDQWQQLIHKLHEMDRQIDHQARTINSLIQHDLPSIDYRQQQSDHRFLEKLSGDASSLIQAMQDQLYRDRATLQTRQDLDELANVVRVLCDKAINKQRLLLNGDSGSHVIDAQDHFKIPMTEEIRQ